MFTALALIAFTLTIRLLHWSVPVCLVSKYSIRRTASLSCDITLTSTLPINAGLGSSAAFCSVVAAFFLHLHGCITSPNLTEDDLSLVHSFANELEKIMHASPSGIDTLISTSGGMICFTKNTTDGSTFIRSLATPLLRDNLPKLLIINTNIPRSTADVVNSVQKFRECTICKKAESIFSSPFDEDSLNVLCKLFLQNHDALCELGVSNAALDEIVRRLRTIGFGAKLTGAGRGGCAIALPCKSVDSRDAVDRTFGNRKAFLVKRCWWYIQFIMSFSRYGSITDRPTHMRVPAFYCKVTNANGSVESECALLSKRALNIFSTTSANVLCLCSCNWVRTSPVAELCLSTHPLATWSEATDYMLHTRDANAKCAFMAKRLKQTFENCPEEFFYHKSAFLVCFNFNLALSADQQFALETATELAYD
ncbi:putative mevalonate kinase [Taenia crassiceps]|uniref:Mevalonate kinase n=1 Tax=Taenia crassiceps TaxID=6207 RepID=A0ABR4QPY1_9CEST